MVDPTTNPHIFCEITSQDRSNANVISCSSIGMTRTHNLNWDKHSQNTKFPFKKTLWVYCIAHTIGLNSLAAEPVAQPLGSNIKIFCLKRGIGGDFRFTWVKEVQKNPFQKYSTELLARYGA